MKNKKLIAADLIKEELQELMSISDMSLINYYAMQRIEILKEAIQELESIALKSDCISCRYNKSAEELSRLNDEEYLQAFDKCRTCCNYYTNNFEEK